MGFEITLVYPLRGKRLFKDEIRFGKSLFVMAQSPFDIGVKIGNFRKRKPKTVVTF